MASALASTRLFELLGCTVPVVLAGMGGVARSELVGAVIDAGGFGFLGMVRENPELIVSEVQALRGSGHTRFGVNIIPAATEGALLQRQIETCLELAVPVVGLFWDIDPDVVTRFRNAGTLVVYQVGSVDEAIAAERCGAGIIVAQGREAGGHVRSTERLATLLPAIIDAVKVPVLAAGGLTTGADLVTALALGAEGVVMGTALLTTTESFAHDYHKTRLIEAGAADTVLTDTYHINWPPGAPVRVLRSLVTEGARRQPDPAMPIVIGEEEGRPIYLFSTDSPLRSTTGEFGSMALYAGTGVGRIGGVEPAAKRIGAVMAAAEALLAPPKDSADQIEVSSPVCYAGEFSGVYSGFVEADELAMVLAEIARDARRLLVAAFYLDDGPDAPPFGSPGSRYARLAWAARMLAMAHPEPPLAGGKAKVSAEPPTPAVLEVSVLGQLASLLPRLPEGATRRAIEHMCRLLEAPDQTWFCAFPASHPIAGNTQ